MSKDYNPPYSIDYSERDPNPNVAELFYQRWSPRSFVPKPIDDETLATIFDAARWTQSAYNEQPWIFLTASCAEPDKFAQFLGLLVEENQVWAKNASLLGFVISHTLSSRTGKPNGSAKFDCGAAWMAMTLQARLLGLYTHGMGGIVRDAIYQEFDISKDQHEVICGFALGCIDEPAKLGADHRAIEKPSPRKALKDIWYRNCFKYKPQPPKL